jgi:hypothetical protein
MGLGSIMLRDIIRQNDKAKAERKRQAARAARARAFPATTKLAAIREQEREQAARAELQRRGISI